MPRIEGGRAPTGAGAEAPHPWPASRSGRSLDRQGSPADDAGRRASRRSTAAFREAETSLQFRAGLPGSGIGAGPVQQAPCRAVLVPPGRGPGAARVLGYEPRPQGPHLAPPNRTSPEDALSEQGELLIHVFLVPNQGLYPHKFVRCWGLCRLTSEACPPSSVGKTRGHGAAGATRNQGPEICRAPGQLRR